MAALLSKAPEAGQGFMEKNGEHWRVREDGMDDLPETGQAMGWVIARFCGSPPTSAGKLVMWGWQSLRATGWKEPQDKSSDLL